MTTLLRSAPQEQAGSTGTTHPSGTTASARRSWPSRLLAVIGPAGAAVGMVFGGGPISPYAVQSLRQRSHGNPR
jgi:hypothetical protein